MDDQEGPVGERARVEALAGRICARAAQEAQATCRLLELIGELDATGGLGFLRGVKSLAHWLSFSCSMSPGVAREHVRVARALRKMPTVTASFRSGDLSYSKMREVTRLVGLVDEARLCELAQSATASQLARMITGYRSASGTRVQQQERRRFGLAHRVEDQMIGLSGKLPAEEAGLVAAALQMARDRSQPDRATDHDQQSGADHEPGWDASNAGDTDRATPPYTDADALLDICRHYLDTAGTAEESGEDRHLVVVEVAAEQLAAESVAETLTPDVPAGTSALPDGAGIGGDADGVGVDDPGAGADVPVAEQIAGVPAETSGTLRSQVCSVRGLGGIEPATAARLSCTGTLLGAVVDAHGDVLALGRSRRLVSKTQRRALMVRDRMCQFPGCAQTRHLNAHHTTPWSQGGRTDLDKLILLCRFHHMAVHEGDIRVTHHHNHDWTFTLPDGETVAPPGRRIDTARRLNQKLIDRRVVPAVDHVDGLGHPDSQTIRPGQTGERFDLHACVQALFRIQHEPAQQAA